MRPRAPQTLQLTFFRPDFSYTGPEALLVEKRGGRVRQSLPSGNKA